MRNDPLVPLPRDLLWYSITLYNRGRVQSGIGSLYRLKAIMEAAKKRYPSLVMSSRGAYPFTLRKRLYGPVVVVVDAIERRH